MSKKQAEPEEKQVEKTSPLVDQFDLLHDKVQALAEDLANLPHEITLALEKIQSAKLLVKVWLDSVTVTGLSEPTSKKK